MAQAWIPLYSFRSVQVFPGNLTVDVERVTFQTVPSGLTATYPVPYESWRSGAGNALIDVIAVQLEELVAQRHAVAGAPGQDIDLNNLMVDFVAVTVAFDRSASGLPPLYGTVNIPVENFFAAETGIGGFTIPGVPTPADLADAEYERLAAIAAG